MRAAARRGVTLTRHPSRWTTRGWAFATLVVAYVAFTVVLMLPGSPLQRMDLSLADLHFGSRHYSWLPWVHFLVGFGQRWIMTQALEVLIVIAAIRARSIRPIATFVLAILALNVSVGVVKYAVGRIGPNYNTNVHEFFVLGGNIYPSGHVSNTVALYGMLALAIPRYRALFASFTAVIAVVVGLGTIYLRTHWFSDVIAGWLAGLLVLVAMPTLMPWAERFGNQLAVWVRNLVRSHPRLHRRVSAARRWLFRVIPPDRSLLEPGRRSTGAARPAGYR